MLDAACGSGLVAIAAALAGARSVTANDIDPLCAAAVALNAEANGVSVAFEGRDLLGASRSVEADVILAGDVFYQQTMAAGFTELLKAAARTGALVLAGDPGRSYAPTEDVSVEATIEVAVSLEIESADVMTVRVLRFVG